MSRRNSQYPPPTQTGSPNKVEHVYVTCGGQKWRSLDRSDHHQLGCARRLGNGCQFSIVAVVVPIFMCGASGDWLQRGSITRGRERPCHSVFSNFSTQIHCGSTRLSVSTSCGCQQLLLTICTSLKRQYG